MASSSQVASNTLVTFKVNLDGTPRRFKLPLSDVGINVLENRLRSVLAIPDDTEATFERYSDSASSYVVLDKANIPVYKQLYRAAKAKQKLKLRVTVKTPEVEENKVPKPASVEDETEEEARPSAEPTDVEPEAEKPVISEPQIIEDLMKRLLAKREPDSRSDSRSPEVERVMEESLGLKEALETMDETPAPPAVTTEPARSDVTHHTAPVCAVARPVLANYAVCCNSCDRTIPDAHYHCSTCDDGDYDLCQDCVNRGVTCNGPTHWLIKRFVKQGVIINSTTERLAPKPKPVPKPRAADAPTTMRARPERIIPVFNDNMYVGIRTCNCCVQELPEVEFVHCTTCEDYDLCRACFAKNRHGHHPRHAFVPAVEGTTLEPEVARRLSSGRGQVHNAICDGCDKNIKGIRHKCLECPDWDYCAACAVDAAFIHPGHRFAPIYEPLEYDTNTRLRAMSRSVHYGICCDGPLCSKAHAGSTYIVGDRYKCAVCNDTDFCESCEASPANSHNRTHPLIKFKTPVRHVSVTTTGENENGRQMGTMGDRPRPRTVVANPANVQTVVDVEPSEPVVVKAEEKNEVQVKKEEIEEKPIAAVQPAPAVDLVATFVQDTVSDGTVFSPDFVFEQTWVLRNTGKTAWPAGCSVKFVGGDYMGHLDSNHPAATRDVEYSCESTICYASIQPGEQFPFTVLLRTPHRTGRIVSNWRLTTKDGNKFGHRLWCDVVVEKPKVVLPPPAAAEALKRDEEKEVIEPESEIEHSQMIFPKLEKESPVASVHEETKEIKAESVSAQDEEEYEDCEDDEWAEGSEEGFLTDEEYDVLDASDEEFLLDGHAKQK